MSQELGQHGSTRTDAVHRSLEQGDNESNLEQPLLITSEGYNGNNQKQSDSIFWTVCPYILSAEFCERLAYYGITGNLMVYLTDQVNVTQQNAAQTIFAFNGLVYLTPLLGAWLADAHLNRFNVIWMASVVYIVGLIIIILQSIDGIPWDEIESHRFGAVFSQRTWLYAALIVVGVGSGGIKPCVSAFGADQFDESIPQQLKEKQSFFNYFYVAVNIGSCLATTVVIYIQTEIDWTIGFIIPCVAMILALLCFVIGKKSYKIAPVGEYSLFRVVKVVYVAIHSILTQPRTTPDPVDPPEPVRNLSANPILQNAYSPVAATRQMPRSQSFSAMYTWLDRAVMTPVPEVSPYPSTVMETAESTHLDSQRSDVALQSHATAHLDRAGHRLGYTKRQVREVKLMVRVIPIFLSTIFYWTIYTQQETFFIAQAQSMFRYVKLPYIGCFEIPAASLALFDTLSILLLLPLYDQALLPFIKRRNGNVTLLQRIGWGLLIAVGSMLLAAVVERVRRNEWHKYNGIRLPHNVTLHDGAKDLKSTGLLEVGNEGRQLSMANNKGMLHGSTDMWQLDLSYDQSQAVYDSQMSVADALQGEQFIVSARQLQAPTLEVDTQATPKTNADAQLAQPDNKQVLRTLPKWYYECIKESIDDKKDPKSMSYWVQISPVHALWLAPQYLLVGASEVMTSVGQLEFFYDQAPERMRSTAMALCLLSTAIGSFIAAGLTKLVDVATKWMPDEQHSSEPGALNYAKIDKYYIFLGFLMASNMAYFIWVAKNYKYKKPDVPPPPEPVEEEHWEEPDVPEPVSPPVPPSQAIPIIFRDSSEQDMAQSLAVRPSSPAFLAPSMR